MSPTALAHRGLISAAPPTHERWKEEGAQNVVGEEGSDLTGRRVEDVGEGLARALRGRETLL
jgi:hypothetical protein